MAITEAQRRLNAARERAVRAALGPPLRLTNLQRDTLAAGGLSNELLPEVEAYVRDAAGAVGVAMVQAVTEEEDG
jgi:hypothetical protein